MLYNMLQVSFSLIWECHLFNRNESAKASLLFAVTVGCCSCWFYGQKARYSKACESWCGCLDWALLGHV